MNKEEPTHPSCLKKGGNTNGKKKSRPYKAACGKYYASDQMRDRHDRQYHSS